MTGDRSDLVNAARRLYALTDTLQARLRVLDENVAPIRVEVRRPTRPTPDADDAEALVFLILLRASEAARDDLEAALENMQEIRDAKEDWRELAKKKDEAAGASDLDFESTLALLAGLYWKELDHEVREIEDDLSSLSELGEVESLRLQMAMDRLSKMMSTLSNILKKTSGTASQIVQNLK